MSIIRPSNSPFDTLLSSFHLLSVFRTCLSRPLVVSPPVSCFVTAPCLDTTSPFLLSLVFRLMTCFKVLRMQPGSEIPHFISSRCYHINHHSHVLYSRTIFGNRSSVRSDQVPTAVSTAGFKPEVHTTFSSPSWPQRPSRRPLINHAQALQCAIPSGEDFITPGVGLMTLCHLSHICRHGYFTSSE